VTQDADIFVDAQSIERTILLLEDAGFRREGFERPAGFKGYSDISIQKIEAI
jgi:hypothetical protein